MKKVLITGVAGFIGYHLAKLLINKGFYVIGIDNINDYYDIKLKISRLKDLGLDSGSIEYNQLYASNNHDNFSFKKLDICDNDNLLSLFKENKFDYVVNLAAQPGVRYSLVNPRAYAETNFMGFFNLLDIIRTNNVEHFVYASSSSVYGLNKKMPYSTKDNVDHPINIYAATKKSNELLAHTYSHLYGIPTTGLRFFTVYGPWGRPDMAYYLFANAIIQNKPINVFNNGNMERDFTFVDDIVTGISKVLENPPTGNKNWNPVESDPSGSVAPYKIYNIGNNKPVKLMDMISALEKCFNKKAVINYQPLQPGDIEKTWADVDDLIENFDYKPSTSIEEGIEKFVNWYKEYYKL